MGVDTNPDIEQRIDYEIVVDCYDSEEVAMGWYYYLEDHLAFPFVATCKKALKASPLKKAEEVTVTGMGDIKELSLNKFPFLLSFWNSRIVPAG